MAQLKEGKKTLVFLTGSHPNEEPMAREVLNAVKQDPLFHSLSKKYDVHIMHMPFELTEHGKNSITKRFIDYLYKNDAEAKQLIEEINEAKKRWAENVYNIGLSIPFVKLRQKLCELMNERVNRYADSEQRGKSRELEEIIEFIKKEKGIGPEERDEMFVREKIGRNPDLIIDLHSSPVENLEEHLAICHRDDGREYVEPKDIPQKLDVLRDSSKISVEFLSTYRDDEEFEANLDFPGSPVPTTEMRDHPPLGNNKPLTLEVPLCAAKLFEFENTSYPLKLGDYIRKAAPTNDQIKKGKEFLLAILQSLQ